MNCSFHLFFQYLAFSRASLFSSRRDIYQSTTKYVKYNQAKNSIILSPISVLSRGCEGFSYGPPKKINSVFNSISWDFKKATPFFKCLSLTIIFYNVISSCIIRLISRRGPSAIRFFIISIIINSIYSHLYRLFAHISKKIRKFMPLFANFYSSSPINRIFITARNITSSKHVLPSLVSRGASQPVLSPASTNSSLHFSIITTAGFSIAISKIYTSYCQFATALTSAIPLSGPAVVSFRTFGNNQKPIKFLSSQINHIWHIVASIYSSYNVDVDMSNNEVYYG